MLKNQYPVDQENSTRLIKNDNEALLVAKTLAEYYEKDAAERDEKRTPPENEMERFASSGLLGCTLPVAYGGADISLTTLVEIIRVISEADPSIGQIPLTHFEAINSLKTLGSDAQKRLYFKRILAGERFGSASSERNTKHARDIKTTLNRHESRFILNGTKFYCAGSQFSQWLQVLALDDNSQLTRVLVPTNGIGVTLHNDWSGFGQRTTGSGSIVFDQVSVNEMQILPAHKLYDNQLSLQGAYVQLLHAAIDAGIASAALSDTMEFVKTKSRPWIDSGKEAAADDPYIVAAIGLLSVKQKAALGLLRKAACTLDRFKDSSVSAEVSAEVSVTVGEARILTMQIALDASQKLFELAGTGSTLSQHGLDRHWRNARTHTLHDPIRWKYKIVGSYWLNDEFPQRHSFI
ncbi:SfnB family sulfur acquisition oxidoreductase [Candidatus Pantoea bituminis]|uniref:SfnB family sulfur acquisition oxidoreductase n=1 Tax=Candidatus Pantoea bituminis TaxID=2831036 RepID=UPI001C06443A|nr:SfnB family sulfur acquisition oxidoreductase [Pantoea bituminis]